MDFIEYGVRLAEAEDNELPKEGDTNVCAHCEEPITFHETPIDDFWSHTDGGRGFCDRESNFLDAKHWAHPKGEDCTCKSMRERG